MPALDAAERLKQDASVLLEAGRNVAREYQGVGSSFRRLVLSDLALARVALIRGLVFLLIAALGAGTAWCALMLMIVVALNQKAGFSLLAALSIPLLISLGLGYYGWHVARKALAFADLDATRRQMASWFPPTQPISTESATGEPNPGPPDPEGKSEEVAPKAP